MKIALDWIADYVSGPLTAEGAEEALINAGLPLESNEMVSVGGGGGGGVQVLDVEVTSNRSDCLSHVGLARELAALLLGVEFRGLAAPATKAGGGEAIGSAAPALTVDIEQAAGCSYYSARLIKGVKIGPSPEWLVRRLEAIGVRAVNNVVDITNYVLMELGQPLHAFDYDRLGGERGGRIVVRRARGGEKMMAIDGKVYDLNPSMLVIADAAQPVAIAGVMGGKATEVGAATTNILLESARFDPVVIRTQSRALTLKSDSSFRFERGIDPAAAEAASLRAAELICQLAGGTLCEGAVRAGSAEKPQLQVTLRLSRIQAVLGIVVPTQAVLAILSKLGFAPRMKGEGLVECTVPSHRLDIEREIDLVEEVARVYGYKHIPALDRVNHPVQPEPVEEKARRTLLQTLAACGFNEALTVTFLRRDEAKFFLPSPQATLIGVTNSDWKLDALRPSLLPSLLQVRRTNQNVGIPDARLFEHAETFYQIGDPVKQAPAQYRMLTLVGHDTSEVRATLDTVVARLNPAARLEATPAEREGGAAYPWYAAGIAATLHLHVADKVIALGSMGQLSEATQARYDLRQTAAGAEVLWDELIAAFEPVRVAKALPTFPGIRRDLSVVVADGVRWAELRAALSAAKLPFLEAIDFVTTFRGKSVGQGKKSLTLTLEFRDPTATLRSEQVDAQMKTALEILSAKFQAVLRG